jgi:hypothetical protein
MLTDEMMDEITDEEQMDEMMDEITDEEQMDENIIGKEPTEEQLAEVEKDDPKEILASLRESEIVMDTTIADYLEFLMETYPLEYLAMKAKGEEYFKEAIVRGAEMNKKVLLQQVETLKRIYPCQSKDELERKQWENQMLSLARELVGGLHVY